MLAHDLLLDDRKAPVGLSVGTVAPDHEHLNSALAALCNAAPPWGKPRHVNAMLVWPREVESELCRLDRHGPLDPRGKLVWVVGIDSWPSDHHDTFRRIVAEAELTLWNATDREAPLVAEMLAAAEKDAVAHRVSSPPTGA